MIQAIIFDMDGLLIDSEPLWQQAEIEILTPLGVPLTPARCLETTGLRIDEAIDYWFQRYPWPIPPLSSASLTPPGRRTAPSHTPLPSGGRSLYEQALPCNRPTPSPSVEGSESDPSTLGEGVGEADGRGSDPSTLGQSGGPLQRNGGRGYESTEVAAVADRVTAQVVALILAQGQGKPGVTHAIQWAQQTGRKLALASSSPYVLIHAALSRLKLTGVFSVVYSAQEESYGKPHPAVYLTTAKKLGVPPEACLAIEDSLNGVLAAKAAKMKCLAVPETHNLRDPRFVIADVTLSTLADAHDGLL